MEELIHRRAHVHVDGQQKPLADNLTVEGLLGEQNIICLEDLSHEIFSVGAHFDTASSILAPFQLTEPAGKFEKNILKAREDKGGFKGEEMEAFLTKLL